MQRVIFGQHMEGGTVVVERVVIETTGLADPAPVINQVQLAACYRLAGLLAAFLLDRMIDTTRAASSTAEAAP